MALMRPAHKTPIWEKTKSKKRKSRLVWIGFLIIFLIIAVNLLVRGPALVRNLNHPFARFPGDDTRPVGLDLSFRTNLLFISYGQDSRLNDIAIVSYEPRDQHLTALFFNLKSNKALQRAAQNIFNQTGVGGLQRFVAGSLGVVIDRYGAFKEDDLFFTAKSLLQIKDNLDSPFVFAKAWSTKKQLDGALKTNLLGGDLWKLFWALRGARFEEKDAVSLNNVDDGSLSKEEVAAQISNLFLDRKILAEGAAVSIRNSSGESGLGSGLELYLSGLGATVVGVESGEKTEPKSLLIVKNDKPAVEKRMASVIGFKKKDAKGENFSGDILVVIGQDAVGELTLP